MFRSVMMATAAVLVLSAATSASAQTICNKRDKIIGYLGESYKESRSGMGLASNGAVIELYTADTGTWTMLITKPGGVTCVMGSGEGWEAVLKPKKAAGEVS